jgi:hypothetical protein
MLLIIIKAKSTDHLTYIDMYFIITCFEVYTEDYRTAFNFVIAGQQLGCNSVMSGSKNTHKLGHQHHLDDHAFLLGENH